MTAELAPRGEPCNHKKVAKTMAEAGITARRHRRRRCTTKPDPAAPPIPDLVGRLFDPDNADVIWCGDIAFMPTDEGWLYLASVLDLGSCRLLGYSMAERADSAHIINAVQLAADVRGRQAKEGTIFHSDRGSTYMSGDYATACARLGLRRSVSRTG